MSTLPTPQPETNAETRQYWEAAAEGRLTIPKCNQCGRFIWYPRELCPDCSTTDVTWTQVSGQGHIYGLSIVRRGAYPDYGDAMPYAYAVVELDEGPRMFTNIVTDDVDSLHIDQPVEVCFDAVDETTAIPRFTVRAN